MTIDVQPGNGFGTAGFLVGATAFLLVLVIFVAGPFAPQPTTGSTLGDIAGEASKGMLRNWLGMEQPTAQRVRTLDDFLELGAIVGAGLAVLLGLFAVLRGERRGIASAAVALGIGAIAIQLFLVTIGMLIGALILAAIVLALGAALGGGL